MRSSTSARRPRSNIAHLVVVSGPSGAGKTTIVSRLLELRPAIVKSISATTRAPRPTERNGVDYLFLSAEEFDHMLAAGEFLETANVHGNWYGTPQAPVDRALAEGKMVVLEIDVQGARSVRIARPDALLIFIEPPSPDTLRRRLEARGTENEQVISRRLSDSARELRAATGFDHRVVNGDVATAVSEVIRILEGTPITRPGGRTGREHPKEHE